MSRIHAEILSIDPLVADVLRRYWEQDDELKFPHKARQLASELRIMTHQFSALVREQTRAVVPEWTCPRCGEPGPVNSRADYQQQGSTRRWSQARGHAGPVCASCHGQEAERKAFAAAQEEQAKRTRLWRRYWPRPLPTREPERCSIADLVFLVALTRAGASEDLAWIAPLHTLPDRLSPTAEFDEKVLLHLNGRCLTSVHTGSTFSAFEWDEKGEPGGFMVGEVFWTIGKDPEEAREFVRRAEALLKSDSWPERWLREIPTLWREVLVEECLQYLAWALDKHRLPFRPGLKTRMTFGNVLDQFSLGQVYNMTLRKTKDAAAAFQSRELSSQQHAANTVPGSIQRFADYARANDWSVYLYRRNPGVPQSFVSSVFFDTALRLGEYAFTTPLTVAEEEMDSLLRQRFETGTSFPLEFS